MRGSDHVSGLRTAVLDLEPDGPFRGCLLLLIQTPRPWCPECVGGTAVPLCLGGVPGQTRTHDVPTCRRCEQGLSRRRPLRGSRWKPPASVWPPSGRAQQPQTPRRPHCLPPAGTDEDEEEGSLRRVSVFRKGPWGSFPCSLEEHPDRRGSREPRVWGCRGPLVVWASRRRRGCCMAQRGKGRSGRHGPHTSLLNSGGLTVPCDASGLRPQTKAAGPVGRPG